MEIIQSQFMLSYFILGILRRNKTIHLIVGFYDFKDGTNIQRFGMKSFLETFSKL